MTRALRFSVLGLGLTAAALLASAAPAPGATSSCRGALPSAALAVPPSHRLGFGLGAVGFQVYACSATPSGPAWTLTGPDAKLYDPSGNLAGTHYAGPTWEAADGSKVAGARVAGATPDPTAIPWLLLGASSHSGEGRMGKVTFVQRLHTAGGLAPSTGCDASSLGAVARVPYTATYCFYEAE